MKHAIAIGLLFGLLSIFAPSISNGQDRVTLFSAIKHPDRQRVFCLSFRSGAVRESAKLCDRVEGIERGSNCTISWRIVPAPSTEVVQGNK